MAIELIPNQPFIFNRSIDACNVGDGQTYCQMIANEDPLRLQFKQTPCGASPLCNETFAETLSAEKTTNGDFSSGSGTAATGWIMVSGTTWNGLGVDYSIADPTAVLRQVSPQIVLVPGHLYRVSFEITKMTTGTLSALLGGTTILTVTANGSYTIDAICGGTTTLQFNGALTNCMIDNVSVKEITVSCWTFSNYSVQTSSSGVCHIPGSGTTATSSATLTNGTYYQIIIQISDRTQGTVSLNIGTGVPIGDPLDSNGTQIVYILAAATQLDIVMSSDFDGCIVSVEALPLRQDFTIDLFDLSGTLIAHLDTQGDLFYYNEFVTLNVFFTYGTLKDIHGANVSYGCYYIGITDPCATEILCDPTFSGTPELCPVGHDWTSSNPSYAEITGSSLYIHDDGVGGKEYVTQAIDLDAFQCYKLTVSIETITVNPVLIQIGTYQIYFNPGTTGTQTVEFTLSSDAILITIEQDSKTGSSAVFNSVSITPCSQYTSNCLNFKETHSCSKFMYAINGGLQQFNWATGFILSIRLKILSINPTYTQEEEDYLYSNGFRTLTYSNAEKYWVIWFNYCDEISHDVIAALINCSTVYLDNVELYFKKGNYSPEWEKDGRQSLAQSRVEAKAKGLTIFNTNCS